MRIHKNIKYVILLLVALSHSVFALQAGSVKDSFTQRTGAAKQPNVLVILLDWTRQDAIGVYSDKPVQTPTLDSLANGGIRYENAYTPATLCSPARASIMTGLYPHNHNLRKTMYPAGIQGALPTMYKRPIDNAFSDPDFNLAINFPLYLTNSGYATGYIGKWHLGVSNPGFFDVFKAYNSLVSHWLGEPQKSLYREDLQTDEAIRFITANADRPFFLFQSFYTPHGPYQPPERFLEAYQDSDIDHREYYASVSSADANIGRILRALTDLDILDNTLIIVSSDHAGSFQERPGSHRGMGIAYDEAAKIPLIISWPGKLPRGKVISSGASLVDIAPTILAATNISVENRVLEIITGKKGSPFDGIDLLAEIDTENDEWSRPVFMQNIPEAAIDGSMFEERAMRYQNWKLILRDFEGDPRLANNALYDLDSDAGEKTNLYYKKEAQQDKMELLELFLEYALAQGDELSTRLVRAELEKDGAPVNRNRSLY